MHRTITRQPIAAPCAIAGAILALGACGGSSSTKDTSAATPATPATTTAAPATGAASVLKLTADPGGALAFDTQALSAKAGSVTIDLSNPKSAGIPHAIAIQGNGVDKDGKIADPGASSSVTVTLKPGKYTYYCPVPGHEAAGMKGTLTVT